MRVELGPERDVGAIGEDGRVLDGWADLLQVDRLGLLYADRALRIADLDVLERVALDGALAVLRATREVSLWGFGRALSARQGGRPGVVGRVSPAGGWVGDVGCSG